MATLVVRSAAAFLLLQATVVHPLLWTPALANAAAETVWGEAWARSDLVGNTAWIARANPHVPLLSSSVGVRDSMYNLTIFAVAEAVAYVAYIGCLTALAGGMYVPDGGHGKVGKKQWTLQRLCRVLLVAAFVVGVLDENRLQPWYWEAALVFFVGGFADGPVQAGWAMAMIQGCLYVFGGLHKLNPDFHVALRFVLEGFPAVAAWLDEPRPVAVDVIVRATAALEGLSGAGYLYAGWALTRGWSSKRFARRVGQACLLFSLGMHAFIVVSLCTTHYVTLSTLDGDRRVALQWWNYAVIPWNVWQVAVLAMLFGGSWDLANGETATRRPAWSIWKRWWALLLVFVLVAPPTGWAFNRGTSTTAFEMYTGNVNVPFIYIRGDEANALPPLFREHAFAPENYKNAPLERSWVAVQSILTMGVEFASAPNLGRFAERRWAEAVCNSMRAAWGRDPVLQFKVINKWNLGGNGTRLLDSYDSCEAIRDRRFTVVAM